MSSDARSLYTGPVTVRRVLLLLAIVCALVFTLVGFDWLISSDHPAGFLGLAIALGLASRWS